MNIARHVRRMTFLLVASLVGLLVAAATAADRAGRPAGRTASAVTSPSLVEYLTRPLFQFSPTKNGVKRRDPFQIPLTKIEIDKPGTERITPERYRQLVAEEEARLAGLKRSLVALRAAIAAGNARQVLRLYQQLESGLAVEFVRRISEAERGRLRAEFEGLKPRMRPLLVEAALASARAKAAAIERAFASGKHEEVVRLAAEFEKLSTIPLAQDAPQWRALKGQVAALARRSRARIEFKNKDLRISSIIVSRRGGAAVINGVSCIQGSRVDPDTIVAEINADRIVFVYKGERIEYPLRPR